MMETKPDRNDLSMRYRLRVAEPYLFDAKFIAGQDVHADTVAFDRFSGPGNAAEPLGDETAHRGGGEVLLGFEGLEEIADAVEIEVAGDDIAALAVFHDVAFRLVLVADFAD